MVSAGTHVVSAVDGTQVPTPSCTEDNEGVTAAEWYSFTAAQDGTISISSNVPASDGGDTRLHVYSGTCAALTCIGFNDDVDVMGGNYLSEVIFEATAGTTYYFAWDDYWEAAGFTFVISELSCDTTIPETHTFASSSQFTLCNEVEDVDGNTIAWIQQSLDLDGDGTPETFATNGSYATAKNDWLFTPSYTFNAGETYQITYRYNGANNGANVANETLEVLVTDEPSSTAGFQEQIGLHTGIVQVGTFQTLHQTAIEQTTTFTPAETSDYNLAFRAITPAAPAGTGNGFLLLFEYSIEVALATPGFNAAKVTMYPNPVKNELHIAQQNTIDAVEIYNIVGQRVHSQSYNSADVVVNTEMLTTGTYMVKVLSQGSTSISKIVKN